MVERRVVEQAWGNVVWHTVPSVTDGNHSFITITPDASSLVGSLVSRTHAAPPTFGLMDVASHQITPIPPMATRMMQAVGASADAEWIVWSEASQQPNLGDWTLYSYNRASGVVKQIATVPVDAQGKPLDGPWILPQVSHGYAVWVEGSPRPSKSVQGIIKLADLANGTTTTLTNNGLAPAISWPHVAWVEPQNEPSKLLPGAARGLIMLHNLETNEQHLLKQPDTPMYFNLYSDTLVWVTSQGKDVMLTDLNETYQQVLIHTNEGGEVFQFPTLNDRLVAWVSYIHTQVRDRQQQRLVTLIADTKGYQPSVFVNGHGFFWPTLSQLSPEQNGVYKAAGEMPPEPPMLVADVTNLRALSR